MRYLIVLICLLLIQCGPSHSDDVAMTGDVRFQTLATGNVIDLGPHVREGRVTVFDFYADWCPPCKELGKSLEDLKKVYGDRLEVYKLDIVSWDSELAQHHGIKDLPYLMVYRENRELLKKGASNQVLPELIQWLNR